MIEHSRMCKCLAILLHCSGHDKVHLSWEGWNICFGETRSLVAVFALLVHFGDGLVEPATLALHHIYLKTLIRNNFHSTSLPYL